MDDAELDRIEAKTRDCCGCKIGAGPCDVTCHDVRALAAEVRRLRAAVPAEREACAALCDAADVRDHDARTAVRLAEAIRGRPAP